MSANTAEKSHLDAQRKGAGRLKAAPQAPPKVGFVSLGCPKALVDSERIITKLRAEGYAIAL